VLSELDADKAESAKQAGIVAEKSAPSWTTPTGCHSNIMAQRKCRWRASLCGRHRRGAVSVNHEASLEDIIKWASMAMYQAKEGGRNWVNFLRS